MNELQISSYARQYYVLEVETRDHVTEILIRAKGGHFEQLHYNVWLTFG